MPYIRRRNTFRRRYGNRNRTYKGNRLNYFNKRAGFSRFRAMQSQTYKSFWFTKNGTVSATTTNGILQLRVSTEDLNPISQFTFTIN